MKMNKIHRSLSILFLLLGVTFGAAAVNGQQLLLNEVEIDPPSNTVDNCQYAEIRGTPGAAVAENTYFLSINSDGNNFGWASQAVNFGGVNVGSNGTIILVNTFSNECPGRVYGKGTTRVSFLSPLPIAQGSETYLIVRSTAPLYSGLDLDTDNDGEFDANLGITVLDGFALIVNPEEEWIYGYSAGVRNISNTISLDQPDAVTRFPNNTTPFAADAFYFGELAAEPEGTTEYIAPFSPNFPEGGRLTPGEQNAPGGTTPGIDAPLDLNGDGLTDLVVVRAAGETGSQLTWHNFLNGSGPVGSNNWGVSGDILLAGDYDGDGKDDITIYRRSNGTFYIIQSSTQTVRLEQLGQDGDDPTIVGDYNGDGKDDPAVFRQGEQSYWYYRPTPISDFVAIPWGRDTDVPAPGDYDGDGKADFVVFRDSSGQGEFWQRLSGGGFSTEIFGNVGDNVVPGDYDGDGKTDVAVVRDSGGNYVWQYEPSSGTPSAPAVTRFWGVTGDIIVQGNYDADATTDLGIWRPGTQSRFYIMTSVGGISIIDWGIAGDQPVANYNTF